MSEGPEDEEEYWFRPVWETDDEAALDPPGRPRAQRQPAEPDYRHPLLTPLARAQDALTRLEARAEMASAAVAEGLRARMSYLEAAGWLRCVHIGIHPWDLALRDNGITGSYAAAAVADRLHGELPSTVLREGGIEAVPSDILVKRRAAAGAAVAPSRGIAHLAAAA